MSPHDLTTAGQFVPPALLRQARTSGVDGVVKNGVVETETGHTLTFRNSPDIEDGSEVRVTVQNGDFVCQTGEERRRAKRRRIHARAREEWERVQKRREEKAEADDFWESYDIPFEFDVGINARRSGLSRGSWGDGRDSRTVNHLIVKESFSEGRLSRDADTFLCKRSGKMQFEEERFDDGQGGTYVPKVTCNRCRDLMERWKTDQDT